MNNEDVQSWDVDSLDEQADQVLNDTQDSAPSAVISEALERIEQAKLYEVFLRQNIFSPGSARPEIIAKVQEEFRAFALSRLEVLVGMQPESSNPIQTTKSPFSEEEVNALKALALRMLKKPIEQVTNPRINPVVGEYTAPEISPITHKTPAGLNVTVRQSGPAKRGGRRKSANVSKITGEDLSQAVSTINKPLPMPDQNGLNAHFAQEAARRGSSAGASEIGKILDVATSHFIKKNQNVKE